MKYHLCPKCGKNVFDAMISDGSIAKLHLSSRLIACETPSEREPEPPYPTPSAQGSTQHDDLLGQLAMMQEFIDVLRNRLIRTGKAIDLNEFMDHWTTVSRAEPFEPIVESVTESFVQTTKTRALQDDIETCKVVLEMHQNAGRDATFIKSTVTWRRLHQMDPTEALKFI